MRIQYKGGVWKNSEDEILKAAVMKYGQNQWARIASLLVRKSAKQCKARWYEWLDPGIKKTEWTREEEEKLLHLVKIMPTSWRTIAPIIGRTATQCLEHYEKLIDQAQQGPQATAGVSASASAGTGVGSSTGGAGPSAAGGAPGSAQRPGDADAFPESRPARPDPVDMDEDELEMLSEARARLANTKGKKAKRKVREKQLEGAKRLAQLQKRRELKAAGVPMKGRRKNRKETDYATEIPFERTAAPGFYDTREEDDRVVQEFSDNKEVGKLLQKHKGKSAQEKEEDARKRDDEKRKKLEKENLPAALGLKKRSAAPRSPPLKRARLSLPPPQLSDADLEKLAKAGALADPRLMYRNIAAKQNGQPSVGVGGRSMNSVGSTPLNPSEPWAAVRRRQLETIMSMKALQTPLRGGDSAPLNLELENGVTPITSALRTPNPLATPFSVSNESHERSSATEAARNKKERLKRMRETVRKGLQALPEPEYDYEIEPAQDVAEGVTEDRAVGDREEEFVEDAEEEEERKRDMYEKEIEIEKERVLSNAAKRGLPLATSGFGKGDEPGTVGYLAYRDNEAYRILEDYAQGKEKASVVVARLKALGEDSSKGSDIAAARKLVEDEMNKAEDGGKRVVNGIVEHLERSRPVRSFHTHEGWKAVKNKRRSKD